MTGATQPSATGKRLLPDWIGQPFGPHKRAFARLATDLLWQYDKPYSAMGQKTNLEAVSDGELRRRLTEFLRQTRCAEADLIAHMAEFDVRRLFAHEAAPSMFAWCTEVLHLSEHEAYLRITVARASREHPVLLAMLRDGRLHLSAICKLAPHLTRQNRERLLKRAEHRSKRQIEELVASLAPRPPASATVRKLPERQGVVAAADVPPGRALLGAGPLGSGDAVPTAPELGPDRVPAPSPFPLARPAVVEPVAPARFRVRFDASSELRNKLERLQALMRSSVPDGDLAALIEVAVTEKLERLEAKRFGKAKAPRKSLAEADTKPKSRYIPAPVRRAVEKRDGGRCTYRDKHGRRCTKRHDLEFHHRRPYARGGEHSPDVLCLTCKTHNQLMAERDYGKEVMARHRRSGTRASEPAAVQAIGSRPEPRPTSPL